MALPKFRRTPRFENLEARELMAAGGPTSQQQYMLELVNQARMNPEAAAVRVTSNLTPDVKATLDYFKVDLNETKQTIINSLPKPPVAWNDALANAAQSHSQDMANTRVQSHSGSDGSTIDSRIAKSGYGQTKSTGENAYAYASNVDEAMQAFMLDWGVADKGHRRNLLQPNVAAEDSFTDVGIGIVKTNDPKFGPVVVTQNFAQSSNPQAQLMGVAYSDNDNSQFYTPGEGQGEVRIDATNLDTGKTTTTTTWASGGYQMTLSPGRYQVVASVNDAVIGASTVTMGKLNVKQDFQMSGTWDGRSRQQLVPSDPPVVKVQSVATASQPTVKVNSPANSPAGKSLAAATVDKTPIGAWSAWKARLA